MGNRDLHLSSGLNEASNTASCIGILRRAWRSEMGKGERQRGLSGCIDKVTYLDRHHTVIERRKQPSNQQAIQNDTSESKEGQIFIQTSILTNDPLLQLRHLILQHNAETKRLKRQPLANKMLTHRLHPMQSQTMQHGARALHHHQHGNRQHEPQPEKQEDGEDAQRAGHGEGVVERHTPQHDGELLMRQRQRPET